MQEHNHVSFTAQELRHIAWALHYAPAFNLEQQQMTGAVRRKLESVIVDALGRVPAEVTAPAPREPSQAMHEHETDRQGRQICTTAGDAPSQARVEQTAETGQHKSYVVLCEEERQKGFVRPYRNSYRHAKCGTVTTMGRALSETYARDPKFYSHTFCVRCDRHLPLAEFVWTADGQPVGS